MGLAKIAFSAARGQGATEYLIILGVVLIIALLAVFILGFFPETGQDISLTESQIYWQGQAKPVRINAVTSGNGTFCGFANVGGYVLAVENTEPDPINITAIGINKVDKPFCRAGAASAGVVRLGGLEKAKIHVYASSNPLCTSNQVISAELRFTYASEYLSNQTESGSKKLVSKCYTTNVSAG